MNKTPCFSPAHILLPSEQIPVGQWGCVACDQFTSDRSYWEKAAQAAAGGPSTLDLILPEVYLEEMTWMQGSAPSMRPWTITPGTC